MLLLVVQHSEKLMQAIVGCRRGPRGHEPVPCGHTSRSAAQMTVFRGLGCLPTVTNSSLLPPHDTATNSLTNIPRPALPPRPVRQQPSNRYKYYQHCRSSLVICTTVLVIPHYKGLEAGGWWFGDHEMLTSYCRHRLEDLSDYYSLFKNADLLS